MTTFETPRAAVAFNAAARADRLRPSCAGPVGALDGPRWLCAAQPPRAVAWSVARALGYNARVAVAALMGCAAARRLRPRRPRRAPRIGCAPMCAAGGGGPGGDGGPPQEAKRDGLADDAAFASELRQRAEELRAQGMRNDQQVAANWREGRALVGPAAVCNDWVRRVALRGDDLFVGTASSGIWRFRLGSLEVRQQFSVSGDATRGVPADHQAEVDPETSITSISYDGRWLAAGLAGGRVHVWHADGTMVLDEPTPATGSGPCYVCLADDAVIAARGKGLLRCSLSLSGPAPRCQETGELSSRAHSLTLLRPDGEVLVGLADGGVEVYRPDLTLSAHVRGLHRGAVSACCIQAEREEDGLVVRLVTGDAFGETCSWRLKGAECKREWTAQHGGRVVALCEGGGGAILSGALDGTVRAWEADTGRPRFAIPGHKVWLGSICVDNGVMVTDGCDDAVRLYDFREAQGDGAE